MKIRELNSILKRFLLLFCVFVVCVGSVMAATINVNPGDSIQAAINGASAGDTILVGAGTYTEDLTIDGTKTNLEIVGADKTTTTIKGVSNVYKDSWPLAVPNIEILADGVKIHGFTIEGPDRVVDYYSSGMVVDGQNIEIYDNNFVTTAAANTDELSHAITTYSKTAIPSADVSGLNIYDNTFTGSGATGCEAVYINPHTGTGAITINNNQFSGSVYVGITAESGNTAVTGNTINTAIAGLYGTRFMDTTYLANYDNIVISGNNIQNFDYGIRIGNGGDGASVFVASILSNTLSNNGVGIWTRKGSQVTATHNSIAGNTAGIQNDIANVVNAEYNYWGAADGPSGEGPGSGDSVSINVDYDPWYIDQGMSVLSEAFANLDATISSRASQESVDAIEAKLDGSNGLAAIYSFIQITYHLIFDTVTPKIDAIEAKLDDETRFTDDTELAALSTQISGISIPDLTSALASIEVKLDNKDAFKADVSGLASQTSVDAIEGKLDQLIIPDPTSVLASIEVKLDNKDAFKADVSGLASQTSVDGIGAQISQLVIPDPTAALSAIEVKLDNKDAFKADVSGLATQASVDAVEGKLDQLVISDPTSALASIEGKLDVPDNFKADVSNLDVPVSSRASQTSVDAIESKADNLQTDVTSIKGELANQDYGLQEIKSEVSAIEGKLPTDGMASQTSVDAIETKIDKLNTDNLDVTVSSRASQDSVTTIDGKVDSIESKLDDETRFVDDAELGTALTGMATESTPGAIEASVSSIESKIDAFDGGSFTSIEAKLDDETRFVDDDELSSVDTKIDSIEGKLDTGLDVPVGTRASQSSVDAIESKADNLQTDVTSIKGELANQDYGLQEIKSEVSAIEGKLPTDGMASQTSVDAVESKLDDPSSGLNAILIFVQNNFNTIINRIDNIITIIGNTDEDIEAIEAKLDDPSIGLAEIKSEIINIENKIDDDVADKGDIEGINNKINALEIKLDTLEAKLDSLIGVRCGNGIIEVGEECDDGNNINGDGCSATCFLEACGDGNIDYGEKCDDGNSVSGDGCNIRCQIEECDDGSDCQGGAVCDEYFMCVGGEKTVVFRTNVQRGRYFRCGPNDNCWIALDFDKDGDLDALGFDGKSTRCNGGTLILKTPEGFDVLDYGHSSKVRVCDDEGREIRFSINKVPQDVELSKQPTEPFTSNDQETLV